MDAGVPISKFICEEIFRVDTAKYGDRLDHVARLGKVKRRMDVLTNLPDKPFIYVLNIQLPGTPPASCVFYFAIPVNSPEWKSKENAKVRRLFEQFIDIPFTPVEGENEATATTEDSSTGALAADVNDDKLDAFQDAVEMPSSLAPPAPLSSESSSSKDGLHTPPRAASPADSVESEVSPLKISTPPATLTRAASTVTAASSSRPAPLQKSHSTSAATTPAAATTAKSWTRYLFHECIICVQLTSIVILCGLMWVSLVSWTERAFRTCDSS